MRALAMVLQSGDGLTISEVIRDIPHDGPAIVIYVMIAAFIALVWAGSRGSDVGSG